MTTEPNHNRIFPLSDLNSYPGSNALDRIIQLFWSATPQRRIWLMTPKSSPTLYLDRKALKPGQVFRGPPRWIDYGIVSLPQMAEVYPTWLGFVQLRFEEMQTAECAEAYLVITTKLELSLNGCTLKDAERQLWGLSQDDVGSTTLQPTRLQAGQPANFVVTYTTGLQGLPAGALVRLVVPKVFSLPQTDDAGAPGYTSLIDTGTDIDIVTIRNMVETHEKSSIICRLNQGLGPGEVFKLSYYTARTFIYTNSLHETEMRTWFSNLPPLTASVAVDEVSPFINMKPENGHSLTFIPGPCQRLHLFLPGRRYTSERLTLKGLFTDYYRNVPPSGPVDAHLDLWLINDGNRRLLASPAAHFTARHRFEIPLPQLTPGIYRVLAYRPGTDEEIARSNPLEITADGAADRLYWGEIHSHTELSDGTGDFAGVFRHAKEEGCLEFATVTDHAEYISDNQWRWMQDVTNAWNEPGRFVTLIGYEWIGKQRDRIIYTARSQLDLLRGEEPHTEELKDFWGHFHNDEAVVGGPHATFVHKTVWEQHDPTIERFAEIYSMWGSCDFRDSPLVAPWIEPDRGISINDILQRGAKLGFTAGGDCHDGRVGFSSEDPDGQGTTPHTNAAILLFRCGMTAANMSHLDRFNLVQSLRNRQTYATTGARILLSFNAAGVPMGAIGQANAVECKATIYAVSPLHEVEIIKDGQRVWSQPLSGLDATVRWQDPDPPVTEHYYYLHVIQEDNQMAWSSPIWIRPL